ncbi:hypothetical protein EMN47_05910 [Prolixibacteraceae bacterium JC049]|nr:hypothetical protein [Prolixibacteraceae bacterium JC049]
MSNITHEVKRIKTTHLPPLPAISWDKINEEAPRNIKFDYKSPNDRLPHADIVVITWTSAEWSALDHVFANSNETRKSYDESWRDNWMLYSRNAMKSDFSKLWGYFRLVEIKGRRVMLFKSEAHLAHPPYIEGLTQMVQNIIDDSQPKHIYSIGTAGGSSLTEMLGDTVITNSGHIILEKKENENVSYNKQTVTCNWFPSLEMQQKITDNLLMSMNQVLTPHELNHLLDRLHKEKPHSLALTLNDLVNAPLNPQNLKQARILPCKNIPLLTTDYYFIADGNDSSGYCTLEMDDTVVGHVAKENQVDFTFVRNISDPIVTSETVSGTAIPSDIRESWSSLIYETCGFYTSFNGALTTWGCIIGKS